jgi:hypothetical protein
MESRFERLLVDLVRGRVDFVVVGGIAVGLSGIVRATDDLDLLVEGSAANLERLLTVLRTVGEGHASELTPADFTDEEGAIRVIEDFPIDVFVRMSGLSYADLVTAQRFADIRGQEVPYLGPEGLIRLKERSMRDRDREDVIRLRALSGEPAMRPRLLRRFLSWVRTRR